MDKKINTANEVDKTASTPAANDKAKAAKPIIIASDNIATIDVKPYIPPVHQRYDLLPASRKNKTEVYAWPEELVEADSHISEHYPTELDRSETYIIPRREESYAQYFARLRDYQQEYASEDPDLAQEIAIAAEFMKLVNRKEYWSIVRFVGKEPVGFKGLTPGHCYYWPCSPEHPEYEGVIDDEEFTSYLYPCDPAYWEIVEDPTHMAVRALAGDADTIDTWDPASDDEHSEFFEWAQSMGLTTKIKGSYYMMLQPYPWAASESEQDTFTCPTCGTSSDFRYWSVVNAQENPELTRAILEGSFFVKTCASCGALVRIGHPCLYLSPEQHWCIYFVTDDQMKAAARKMFKGLHADDDRLTATGDYEGPAMSTHRIVCTPSEFIDKVCVCEAGLDDRVVELVKLGVAGLARDNSSLPADLADDAYYLRFAGEHDGALSFEIERVDDPSASRGCEISKGAYGLFADLLSRSPMATAQAFLVGRRWARSASEVLPKE